MNPTNGALAPIGACPVIGTPSPTGLAVDPTSRFLYVANQAQNTISLFTINSANGCLAPGPIIPTGAGSTSIGINSSGACLYVSNQGANTVSGYSINPITGALVLAAIAPTAAGPKGIAVDPFGQSI